MVLEAAGDLFRALAAPLRLAIVVELASGPRSVHELVNALGASQPLISQHLRILRGARLVTAQRRQHERVYTMAGTSIPSPRLHHPRRGTRRT